MSKYFWVILVGVVVALGAVFMLSGGKSGGTNTGEFAYTEPLANVQTHDHKKGKPVKATIIEYGDFQCPSCAALSSVVSQVEQNYGDEVEIVFRNFPLTQIHPQAMSAHRAAEAASNQGMFWEMHDQLFASQQSWSGDPNASGIFESFAEQLGLDMDKYREDVASESVFSKINSDLNSGKTLGVASTPTLFLNGEQLESVPRTLEEWIAVIEGNEENHQEN